MRSVNIDLLWNKWDKIRAYDRVLIEAYSTVKRVMENEVQARKNYALAIKIQIDTISKLSSDLKSKPHFQIFQDSLNILKDLKTRQIDRFRKETDDMMDMVYKPLNEKLTTNEEVLGLISQGEKSFFSWATLSKTVSESYNKFYNSGQQYDLVFEDEQVKQQVKNHTFKLFRPKSTKAIKIYEKMKEEERNYKSAVENYNRHTSSYMNDNVVPYLCREKG